MIYSSDLYAFTIINRFLAVCNTKRHKNPKDLSENTKTKQNLQQPGIVPAKLSLFSQEVNVGHKQLHYGRPFQGAIPIAEKKKLPCSHIHTPWPPQNSIQAILASPDTIGLVNEKMKS